jgi:hypothetical protein
MSEPNQPTDEVIQRVLDTLIPSSRVGPMVGVSVCNLHRLDDQLMPFRVGSANWYRREVIERYAEIHRLDRAYTLSGRDVCRMLRLSDGTVKSLDAVLQPVIIDRGGKKDRHYKPSTVLAFLENRSATTHVAPSKRDVPKQTIKVNDSKARIVGAVESERAKAVEAADRAVIRRRKDDA